MSNEKTRTEEYEVEGDDLLAKIKELVREGNVCRIVIKDEEGKAILDMPLTVGVVGIVIAPKLAAIVALAAIIKHGTIVIERETD